MTSNSILNIIFWSQITGKSRSYHVVLCYELICFFFFLEFNCLSVCFPTILTFFHFWTVAKKQKVPISGMLFLALEQISVLMTTVKLILVDKSQVEMHGAVLYEEEWNERNNNKRACSNEKKKKHEEPIFKQNVFIKQK